MLHYGFLWSNSAVVWFWGRSDWTDTFQNTFAFENGGLSAKITILERYTCRANLEQAEQFRHDSYELPQSLKYWGLLITQNLGHDLNYEYLVFYFGKHIGKGKHVTAICPQIIPNVPGRHQHIVNTLSTRNQSVDEPMLLVQWRGWAPESDRLHGYLDSSTYSVCELGWVSVCSFAKWGECFLTHGIIVLNWSC